MFYADIIAIIIDGYFEFGISLFLQVWFDWNDLFKYKAVRDERLLQDEEEGTGTFLDNLESVESSVYLGDAISRFWALLLFICLFILLPIALLQITFKDFEKVKSPDF